jgi:hypothetical protein
MKKGTRILTLGALAVIALARPQPASATCPNSLPVQHGLGSFFANCPDAAPVDGYLYVLGQDATMNSNSTTAAAGADQKIDFVCEATGTQTEQLIDCQPEAGGPGDGQVTVSFDWGGINLSNGSVCPNPGGVPGTARNIIQVVANDGSSLVATVGFSGDFGYYLVEAAGPADFAPLSCSSDNGLTLVSGTPGLQAFTYCLQQAGAPVHDDCDPGSAGAQFYNTCQGGTGTPIVSAPGNLYTRTAPCAGTPDLRRSAWQLLTSTPGPGGSKCVTVDVLPSPGNCVYIGGSTIFSDGATAATESASLTGYLRGCCIAAVDKVVIKKAALLQGRLRVDFSTENEALIVGFNVYAGGTKLNAGFIQANGTGSNDYSFEVGRGALKSERAITVEAVMSDGTTVRTASETAR